MLNIANSLSPVPGRQLMMFSFRVPGHAPQSPTAIHAVAMAQVDKPKIKLWHPTLESGEYLSKKKMIHCKNELVGVNPRCKPNTKIV